MTSYCVFLFCLQQTIFRSPKVVEEPDNDCDMPEITRHDDDTDIESFEREEQRMEEEAAKVRIQ